MSRAASGSSEIGGSSGSRSAGAVARTARGASAPLGPPRSTPGRVGADCDRTLLDGERPALAAGRAAPPGDSVGAAAAARVRARLGDGGDAGPPGDSVGAAAADRVRARQVGRARDVLADRGAAARLATRAAVGLPRAVRAAPAAPLAAGRATLVAAPFV